MRIRMHLALLGLLGLLASAVTAHAATYSVGPGQPYTTLGSVPWNQLQPGDTVQIYWQPQGYHEKILLSASGTATQPISVYGVPGPSGQLPVIDGNNATTSSQFSYPYPPTQDRGLLIISLNSQQAYGYRPSYINIANLVFQNANVPNNYTDGQGLTRSYISNAAGIYVERGEHIRVWGCTITNNCNGFFVASGDVEAQQSRDIYLGGSTIYGNGVVGSYLEHNVYTEAIGVVFEYNYLGPPVAGSLGNNLKDRSAGTVIRYNWVNGGAHLLDLVEAQASWPTASADPSYRQTFVYGNVLVDPPNQATYMVHYGGDQGNPTYYRNGWLYFYNNTVVNTCDQIGAGGRWRTIVLNLEDNGQSADVRNNVLFSQSFTPGRAGAIFCMLNTTGVANFGVNWVSPGWSLGHDVFPFTGTATGLSNLVTNAANAPGFVNLAGNNVTLAANSPCLAMAGVLAPQAAGLYNITSQYVTPQAGLPTPVVVNDTDLGAYQSGKPVPNPYTISGQVTAQGIGVAGVTVGIGSESTTTASDGSYALTGLAAGTYPVSASGSSYTFGPAQMISVGPSQTGVNFAATAVYTISGKVTAQGAGVSGVVVTVGNATVGTAPDGSYSVTGLVAGTYAVSVSNASYTFSGAQQVTVGPTSATANFTAIPLFTISGKVTAQGAGMAWLTVTAGNFTTTTAADGSYTLSSLPAGTYTVSVSSSYSNFSGPQQITVGPSQSAVNFTSTVWITSLTLTPSLAKSGTTITGTVTLNTPVTANTYVPLFTSNSNMAQTPWYVTVTQGNSSATFTIPLSKLTAPAKAVISALYSGITVNANLSVLP